MNERLLQFIWQFQHFNTRSLILSSGESLQIIHPGTWNHQQGPDFSSAKIKIGDTLWAGNIEIHILASDWYKHAHDGDPNYQNIILHVVWQEDEIVRDTKGHCIPTLVLAGKIPGVVLDRYAQMMDTVRQVPCHHFLPGANELVWYAWKVLAMADDDRAMKPAKALFG